jgi:UDP-N-acetylmuramoyl-L-alanyl-D-glutamate--2,6-diaminopimelate ligase
MSTLQVEEIMGEPFELQADVEGISYNSRKVEKDFIFVCINGFKTDGHLYIKDAVRRGAKWIVVQKILHPPQGVALIRVPETRLALAKLASKFYNNPSHKLKLIGITGTNGKTTTSYLIHSIFREVGIKTALIGTITHTIDECSSAASITTPESLDLQRMMHEMVKRGVKVLIMEVSSHGLQLNRVAECKFDVGVFTNLTQDHLDFHHTFLNYLKAKARLFDAVRVALVNADDKRTPYIIKNASCKIMSYGIERGDIRAEGINFFPEHTEFKIMTSAGVNFVKLPLVGKFNVYNALGAIGVAVSQGIKLKDAIRGIEKAKLPPGRFQLIDRGQGFKVIVDYAHTPDALRRVLCAARQVTSGKLILVFGCGGGRDRLKRPLMGQIAAKLTDFFILTTDNPRDEDPLQIIREIEAPLRMERVKNYTIIEDRIHAIRNAISRAQKDDIVIIAGRGHENYQILKEGKILLNDGEVVEQALYDLQRSSRLSL